MQGGSEGDGVSLFKRKRWRLLTQNGVALEIQYDVTVHARQTFTAALRVKQKAMIAPEVFHPFLQWNCDLTNASRSSESGETVDDVGTAMKRRRLLCEGNSHRH